MSRTSPATYLIALKKTSVPAIEVFLFLYCQQLSLHAMHITSDRPQSNKASQSGQEEKCWCSGSQCNAQGSVICNRPNHKRRRRVSK